jgi:hypothetical protein
MLLNRAFSLAQKPPVSACFTFCGGVDFGLLEEEYLGTEGLDREGETEGGSLTAGVAGGGREGIEGGGVLLEFPEDGAR